MAGFQFRNERLKALLGRILSSSGAAILAECIQKVATGYEYSRSLSRAEADAAMSFILDGQADEVQAAVFLIALRMKRETIDENLGLQDALLDRLNSTRVDVPILTALSDPYDGLKRSAPVSTFLPATLAAAGLPAFSHGVDEIGPKFGVTQAQVLAALGYDCVAEPSVLVDHLEADDIGWAFINLKRFHPELAALKDLRNRMIKRTALATIERTHKPFAAVGKTLLVTGHVHTAYPEIYIKLARNAGFAGCATYKGYEGSLIPPLHQNITLFSYLDQSDDLRRELQASEMQVQGMIEKVATQDKSVETLIAASMAALHGEKNSAYQSLVLSGSLALLASGVEVSVEKAAQRLRQSIDSGAAFAHFSNGLRSNSVRRED